MSSTAAFVLLGALALGGILFGVRAELRRRESEGHLRAQLEQAARALKAVQELEAIRHLAKAEADAKAAAIRRELERPTEPIEDVLRWAEELAEAIKGGRWEP